MKMRTVLIWAALMVAYICAAFNILLVVIAIPAFTILGYYWGFRDCWNKKRGRGNTVTAKLLRSKPTPTGHVYHAWEHTDWGNTLRFSDWEDRRIVGWLSRTPRVGDEFQFKMESGQIGRFLVKEVEPCADPLDMFFAVVEDMGYLEREQ